MKFNLRKKLTMVFILLITIPMIGQGVFSYFQTSKALQSTIENELIVTSNEAAEAINRQVAFAKSFIELASHNQSFIKAALPDSELTIKDETHRTLSDMIKSNSGLLETLVVVNKSGKGIVSSDGTNITMDLSEREYFKKAVSGSAAISDVIRSKATNNLVVAIGQPLKQNNEVVGVLVGTIKFSSITENVSEVKVAGNGYAYMINKEGVLIYHPVEEKILNENVSNTKEEDLKVFIEEMKAGKANKGFYNYEGVKKFMSFEPAGQWSVAVTSTYKEYMKPAYEIRNITIIVVIGSIILAILIGYLFSSKGIVEPIKKLEGLMNLAGQGDLRVRSDIRTGDEIESLGDCFNKMMKEQEEIVSKVRAGAKDLAASAEEMASSSQEISASTEEVAASIQEVAMGSENQNTAVITASQVLVQLSSLVQLAQAKAVSSSENAGNTRIAAESGRERVSETVKAMDIINSSTKETAEILKNVNELSVKVENIVGTINSIAEQTNLLALNAAIEAARAGEHGRGFTVVAEEVRKLSDESNAGAKEISGLITEMSSNVNKAVASMTSAINAVNNGVSVVDDTDKSLVDIIEEVNKIVGDVEHIVDITNDEVATSDQIIKLIDNIGTISENNSTSSQQVSSATEEQTASVENLAATAEEVSSMAEALEAMVLRFKVGSDQ